MNTYNTNFYKKSDWLSSSKAGHLVQFYQDTESLQTPLAEFIGNGLLAGDTCIVIATKGHLRALNSSMKKSVDLAAARKSGHYITADAGETLASLMTDGLPDWDKFSNVIGQIMAGVKNGRPIRAFGEMVALLWKEGNQEGALLLEKFWNDLTAKYTFSLYCAYPMNHFDRSIHSHALDEITQQHTHSTPTFTVVIK